MPVRSSNGDGFTLLEILVALVILGLALAFLTSTISDSLARAERIETEDRAATLADTLLARLGEDIPLQTGVTQGQNGKLFWRLVVTPEPGASVAIPFDEIDLTIAGPRRHSIGHWQTLRVAPQASAP